MTSLLDLAVPFDGQTVSPRKWRAMSRSELLDGPLRGEGNELVVSVPAVGLTVRVATGHAALGGVHVENTSTKSLTCDPADPNHGRRDLVVAGVNYDTRSAFVDILTGIPSAAPVAPVPNDADRLEIPLAEVAVAAGDTVLAAGDITDVRMFAVPTNGAGGLIGRLSVDADSTTAAANTNEQLYPGWSLDVVLRLGRVYRIGFSGDSDENTNTIRLRDGGLTGTLLGAETFAATGGDVLLVGLFDALDEGVHTIVVTGKRGSAATSTIRGATAAAVADSAYRRPWLLVFDDGPVHT